ncbi:polysaccharide deacetylase family protein [Fulvivirgaceae bacterium BMA12]|uniref:Polysaccharide deacetylase family protein n=1 Tax=Agaribacillus aureus TaxID=3051825 RepID=A0ABT8L2Z7_9BACT|nr:polysaccharide deacetylase family protein [Fulvivirgaceae bacterium BMA12]
MKSIFLALVLFFAMIDNGLAQDPPAGNGKTGKRLMAVTIDDLPVNSIVREFSHRMYITEKILQALKNHEVPGIGFVNESKLYKKGQLSEQEVSLLQKWIDNGMELGNHGYSHADYNNVTIDEYKTDVLEGEKVTKKILSAQNQRLKYFRHPYLHVGNSQEKKVALEKFLAEKGYEVAPVTIDNSEWIFARAYEIAFMEKDSTMMKKIGMAYVDYMEEKTAYFEGQSKKLWNYEIKQILLIHANQLNADYLDPLLARMNKRNYDFISLEKALTDKVYESEDTFVGKAGISWIDRWALSMGKKGSFFQGEPRTPQFVQDVAKITE